MNYLFIQLDNSNFAHPKQALYQAQHRTTTASYCPIITGANTPTTVVIYVNKPISSTVNNRVLIGVVITEKNCAATEPVKSTITDFKKSFFFASQKHLLIHVFISLQYTIIFSHYFPQSISRTPPKSSGVYKITNFSKNRTYIFPAYGSPHSLQTYISYRLLCFVPI